MSDVSRAPQSPAPQSPATQPPATATQPPTAQPPAAADPPATRWSTRKTVTLALFTALSVILSFVEIAVFPAAPYLKYDPSGVVAAFATFAYGPASGVIVGLVTAALHALIAGDPWGGVMMAIVVVCWVVPAGLVYKRKPTRTGALAALVVGAVFMLAGAIVGNILVTPVYSGTTVAAVLALIVPVLLPFNIIKCVINIILTWLLYAPLQQLIETRAR